MGHTSETDLAVAAACQYFAVFCFALLCIHYFPKYQQGAIADYIFALRTVGFLGLWVYVVMGTAQSILNIILAFGGDLNLDTSAAQGLKDNFDPLMSLCTILCVINMSGIFKIRDLTSPKALDRNANTKFLGTRVLLLAGTIQPKILDFILQVKDESTGQSALQIALSKHWNWPRLDSALEHAGKSDIQIQLWNTSLLCFWCLLVAAANLGFWRKMPCKPCRDVGELGAHLLKVDEP